jgi:hypothetical protein
MPPSHDREHGDHVDHNVYAHDAAAAVDDGVTDENEDLHDALFVW